MKLKVLTMAAIALCLAGCATASPVFLADGSKGYDIACGGTVMNFSNCLAKAGSICGSRGYEVVNKNGDAIPYAVSTGGLSANQAAASGGYTSVSGMMVSRNLFIKCR